MELENMNRITLERRPRKSHLARAERYRMATIGLAILCAILTWFLIGAIHANHEMQVQMMVSEAK